MQYNQLKIVTRFLSIENRNNTGVAENMARDTIEGHNIFFCILLSSTPAEDANDARMDAATASEAFIKRVTKVNRRETTAD